MLSGKLRSQDSGKLAMPRSGSLLVVGCFVLLDKSLHKLDLGPPCAPDRAR